VGEALTLPVLKTSAARTTSSLVRAVIQRIASDESAHAEIGPWFLDWADGALSEADRVHLGRVAGAAIRAFAPIFSSACHGTSALGVLACADYDATFARALDKRVIEPLAERGMHVPAEDLAAVGRGA
jgi:hypothetical protein